MVRRNLAPTSSAGPTSSPAGRSIWPTAAPRPRRLCAGRSDAEASALLGFESGRAGLLGGRRARDLRRGRSAAGPTRRRPRAAGRRRRGGGPPGGGPVAASTTAACASSTCAATRSCASRWTRSTTSRTGSPRVGRRGATTPGSSLPPPRPDSGPPTTTARRSPRCGSPRTMRWRNTGRATSKSSSRRSATLQAIGRFSTSTALLDAAAEASERGARH